MKKLSLSGLSSLGLQMDGAIDGRIVTAAKKTNRPNVVQITHTAADGKDPKHCFVGAKSIEEGLLLQDEKTGVVTIAEGFESYTNKEGQVWVRNRNNVNTLAVV